MSTRLIKNPLTAAILGGALLLGNVARADAPDPKTERTWKAKCASCHGEKGKGDTDQGKKMAIRDLSSPAVQKEFNAAKIKEAIENGMKGTRDGKKQEMDGYKAKLKPEQIDALVAYVQGLAK